MKVVLVQQDIVWSNPQANIDRLEALLSEAPQADLFVLPEMFTTGFATAPEGVAEEMPARGLLWMREFARRRDCAVAGSIAVHEGDHYCNRLYFVTPEGETYYDKRHLFTYSGEDKTFKASDRAALKKELDGVKRDCAALQKRFCKLNEHYLKHPERAFGAWGYAGEIDHLNNCL